jgi:hypothetical protein
LLTVFFSRRSQIGGLLEGSLEKDNTSSEEGSKGVHVNKKRSQYMVVVNMSRMHLNWVEARHHNRRI